ncbi:energy transducer TonB [Undibacterium sp. TJN25]|uniref:energy transducer TonB n=1 Tax=Undibacterium sp. TJN25 TaxID=3413056 RepID=UPI003BF12D50
MRKFCVLLFSLFCVTMLASGCQKKPPQEDPVAPAAPASQAEASRPTGLVKNAVRHTDQTADVTKWMDQASTKTAAQLAAEEKQAKEAKAAQDAKLAQDAKAAKTATAQAPAVHEAAKPAAAAAPPPQVVTPKVVEVAASSSTAPAAAAPKPAAPAPAVAAVAAAEQNVLKLLSSSQPSFPGLAARAGLTEGVVSARIHVDTGGNVSHVDILKAVPAKYFDKEVIAAASAWKYAPISSPQTKVLEFHFKLDN